MRVGDVEKAEFFRRLSEEGVCLKVGPITAHIIVKVPDAFESFYAMYAAHPVALGQDPSQFVDAYVSCLPHRDPRNPLRERVHLYIDGRFHAAVKYARLAVPALEWTLNWAFATRLHEFLVLHAAILARNGRALILPAPPGSGKSTLCAALAASGWRLLSDELTMLRPEDGHAVPCPRPVSLKEGSIEQMRRFAPQHMLQRTFPGTSKGTVGYLIPPPESVEGQDVPALPAWVAFPRWREGKAQPASNRLSEVETFLSLNFNAVNYDLMGEIAPVLLTNLARTCPAYEFEYGSLETGVAAIEELVA